MCHGNQLSLARSGSGGKHPAVALLYAFQINILFPIQQLFSGCFSQRSRWLTRWYLMPDQRDCPAQNHPAGRTEQVSCFVFSQGGKKKRAKGRDGQAASLLLSAWHSPCEPSSGQGWAAGTPRSGHGSSSRHEHLAALQAAFPPVLPNFTLCLPPLPTSASPTPPSLPPSTLQDAHLHPGPPASQRGGQSRALPGWWPTSPRPPGQRAAAECHR